MRRDEVTVGQAVLYLDRIKARVVAVASNGVTITYWGSGLKEGQCLRRRVAARYLLPEIRNAA